MHKAVMEIFYTNILVDVGNSFFFSVADVCLTLLETSKEVGDCPALHSHLPHMRVPGAPHPSQHAVLLECLFLAVLVVTL